MRVYRNKEFTTVTFRKPDMEGYGIDVVSSVEFGSITYQKESGTVVMRIGRRIGKPEDWERFEEYCLTRVKNTM